MPRTYIGGRPCSAPPDCAPSMHMRRAHWMAHDGRHVGEMRNACGTFLYSYPYTCLLHTPPKSAMTTMSAHQNPHRKSTSENHACLYTCVRTRLCTCLCTCLYKCLCAWVGGLSQRSRAFLDRCLHTCLHACVCTCLYACPHTEGPSIVQCSRCKTELLIEDRGLNTHIKGGSAIRRSLVRRDVIYFLRTKVHSHI